MIDIVSELVAIKGELEDLNDTDMADKVAEIIESYKPRVQKQRRSRGVTRIRRKKYYRKNRVKIKRRQKVYRKRRRTQLKRRKRLRHFKRIGEIVNNILNFNIF